VIVSSGKDEEQLEILFIAGGVQDGKQWGSLL
jgi:hypothetical protein